ncbi:MULTISPECIES: hypothetical protein [Enterococcus]|uniref:hypothetical protein n=1 Tax=Enterococcus TaxID=1350 RepID=UPI0019262222|nr:hypothetical protein [Enterococcus faecalis]MCD4978773.1 hypothetical protein [Enterococcus faecalis]MCU2263455.1 hypothetical protein [Enterococcus faecalis]MDG4629375.1 hypothetical protein [Enterococcus faecalis]MDG4632071.1 hypothetical protein [Enterococcus faecalis]
MFFLEEVIKPLLDSKLTYVDSYISLINESELYKEIIKKIREEANVEEFNNLSTPTLKFNYVLSNQHISLNSLNSLILDNIQFNCSNIFFEKINTRLDDNDIIKAFERITKNFSLKNVASNYHEELKSSGYNLLDRITASVENELYFPVLEFSKSYIRIMSVVSFLDSDGIRSKRVCIVKINRENGQMSFYVNGKIGKFKLKNLDSITINSPLSFFQEIKLLIGKYLSIVYESKKSVYKKEREKMFIFCKKMNNLMIGQESNALKEYLFSTLKRQIKTISKKMNTLNNNVKLNEDIIERIQGKIFSTYLGEYITQGFPEDTLKKNSIEEGCTCYPTKISFKGQELSRGRASARNKNFPLTFESVFYSLNTDIEISGELDEFTLAWFDKPFFPEKKDLSVSQTTIKINKGYFSIVILNKKYKNREMVEFIERTIRTAIS